MKLTRCQQIIYNSEKYIGGSISVTCGIMTVDKSVPEDKLISAVREIYSTNYSLNLKLTETADGPELIYCSPEGRAIETVRVGDKAELEAIGNRISVEPFDPSAWLSELFPVIFPGGYGIIVKLHHIIGDAASMSLIGTQLNELLEGKTSERYSYEEYSAAEEKYLSGPRYEKDRLFFIEEYKKCKEPVLFFENSGENYKTKKLTCNIPRELCGRLTAFSEENNIPEYTCLLSALAFTYSRLRNYPEAFFIGIPTDSRVTAANAKTVGMFTNPLPLRIEPDCEKTLKENAAAIQNSLFTLLKHQKFGFSDLQKTLKDEFGFTGKLYDCSFNYQPDIISSDWNMSSKDYYRDVQSENIQFFFNKRNGEKGYVVDVVYRESVVSDSKAQTIYDSFLICLSSLINDDIRLKDIDIIKKKDYEVFFKANNTSSEFANTSMYSLFEKQLKLDPDRICIRDKNCSYSMRRLDADARKTDAFIRERTGGKKQVIGLICDRSYLEIALIFGIVRSGCAYLPISPDYPAQRIKDIINTADCSLVIAQKEYLSLCDCAVSPDEILRDDAPVTDFPSLAVPDDLLYVIFTSGSTGKPKGASVTNRSAVNRINWMAKRYFDGNTVVMLKTPYTFDVSVWEIFGFAAFGFSIYILPPDAHYDQAQVLDCIAEGGVTDIHFVPSIFNRFLSVLGQSGKAEALPVSLKNVFLSGEVLTAAQVNTFNKYHNGRIGVHNLYGPAECAVDVTYYDCGAAETDPVPIGRPVDNTQIHIVDKNLKPVPVGIQGQIAVAGTNVGEGYINDSEKTAAVFVDNPFGSGKLYLTGDLGYWREDGNIIYSGRNDFQIKLRGQRIEPGEIESVICSTPGVKEASVCAAGNPDRLIAFYTGNADARAVKTAVRNLLPFYMQPSNYIALDEMPLNSSGKTDKKALKAAAEKTVYEPDEVELPLNETEKAVCTAFSEVLGTDGTGRNQSFYELGGTSLDIVNLLSYDIFKGLTPQDILHASTPAAIAALLTQDRHGSSLLKALYEPDGAETALILFPFAGGDASAFTALTAVFRRKELPVSLYFVDWLKNGTEYERCAEEIQHLAEAKRICFYSHCAGSVIAMKLIERLNTRENTVSLYIAGGNIPPKHRSPVNIWRAVPETALINLLKKAGLSTDGLQEHSLKKLINNFRINTDEYFDYFGKSRKKITCQIYLIISKYDIFTKNYKSSKTVWGKYGSTVSLAFIESKNHYFQSSDAEKTANILEKIIERK